MQKKYPSGFHDARLSQKNFALPSEKVSIIICCRNEEHNLNTLLKSIVSLDLTKLNSEFIFVDDRSSDSTLEILSTFKAKHHKIFPDMRVIRITECPPNQSPKKHALTTGILNSKGSLILCTDADVELGENWVKSMISPFCDSQVEIILGYSPYKKSKSLVDLFLQVETDTTAILYLSKALSGKPYMGVGRSLAYRKKCFERVGGFDSHMDVLSGDDDLFIQSTATSCNTSVVFNSESIVYSTPPDSFIKWIRQKKRHVKASIKYSFSVKIFLSVFHGSQILFYLLFFVLLTIQINLNFIILGFMSFLILKVLGLSLFRQLTQKEIGLNIINFVKNLTGEFLSPIYYIIVGLYSFLGSVIQNIIEPGIIKRPIRQGFCGKLDTWK